MVDVTNCVYAALPNIDMETAYFVMAGFGDVAHVGSENGMLVITYFDVRAARRATEELGAGHCWFAMPRGDMTARLPGATAVETEDFDCISNITQDHDSYILEFFDLRDAARYREQYESSSLVQRSAASPKGIPIRKACPESPSTSSTESPKTSRASSPSCSAATTPCKANGGGSPVHTTKSMHTVRISGLPATMMDRAMLEAVLEQAGFEGSVLSFTTCKTSTGGEATVHFSEYSTAAKCVFHFHGRRWTTVPVEAFLVEDSADDTDTSIVNFTPPPGLEMPVPPGLGGNQDRFMLWSAGMMAAK